MSAPDVLLTIVIPVFNASNTIERTLRSLERLSPENRALVQIVTVDDGSTDDSARRVRAYFREADFPHHRLLEKPNGGSASARNLGLKHAAGRYLYFLDADDELAADLVPFIRGASEASAAVFSVEFRRNEEPFGRHIPRRVDRANHLDALTAANPFVLSCIAIRRDRVDFPFDERFLSREDWLFWMRNERVFDRVAYHTDVTAAIVHAHGANKSANYERAGAFREKVARTFLEEHARSLSIKQRNNLAIQAEIGRIQQNGWPRLGAFVRFPCSARLYAKLWAYAVLRRGLRRFDFYGSGGGPSRRR